MADLQANGQGQQPLDSILDVDCEKNGVQSLLKAIAALRPFPARQMFPLASLALSLWLLLHTTVGDVANFSEGNFCGPLGW